MKRYCKVYYRTCAYGPCSRPFSVGYERMRVTLCSPECVAAAARDRTTPAEGARRARLRRSPEVGRTTSKAEPRPCDSCAEPFRPMLPSQRWCRTCAPTATARHRLKTYGVSEPQWRAMLARYGGACWICRTEPGWALDHDHATGRARGALCVSCNVRLAPVEDRLWLARAEAYLLEAEEASDGEARREEPRTTRWTSGRDQPPGEVVLLEPGNVSRAS